MIFNLKAVFRSFGFAFAGIGYILKTQNNARFHLLATVLAVAFSIWLKISLLDWCFILLAVCLVWIAESFNTALEKFFDLVQPEPSHLVKHGKDCSAAAVLITTVLSVVIGVIILGPPLFARIELLFNRG